MTPYCHVTMMYCGRSISCCREGTCAYLISVIFYNLYTDTTQSLAHSLYHRTTLIEMWILVSIIPVSVWALNLMPPSLSRLPVLLHGGVWGRPNFLPVVHLSFVGDIYRRTRRRIVRWHGEGRGGEPFHIVYHSLVLDI